MSAPEADAARRILADTAETAADSATNEALQTFYALVQLLPQREASGFPAASDHEPPPAASRRAKARRTRHTVAIPVAALVALIVALVFVATLLFLPRDGFAPETAVYLSGTGAARAARGVALAGQERTIIFASGLSELTSGYRYVAWRVDEDGYERLGSLVTLGAGRARLRTAAAPDAEQIEVTIEQSTSTGDPKGPTVLAGFRRLE
ncbi:MAG: hypothetical protein ACOC6J_03715 [Spirochaetota bacterium]